VKIAGFMLLALWLLIPAVRDVLANPSSAEGEQSPGREMAQQATKGAKRWITTDHSKHEVLKQPFASGPEVTKTCLSCHSEAAAQIHKTIHWTWVVASPETNHGHGAHGRNYASALRQRPRCTSCHIGYGWKDKSFDFTDPSKVDCLVCHEHTGTYKKFPAGAGNPVKEPILFPGDGVQYLPPEWNKVAQSVGRPTRENCGACHFYGGGGDRVKHGDLDPQAKRTRPWTSWGRQQEPTTRATTTTPTRWQAISRPGRHGRKTQLRMI
jgi:hypothetical protein